MWGCRAGRCVTAHRQSVMSNPVGGTMTRALWERARPQHKRSPLLSNGSPVRNLPKHLTTYLLLCACTRACARLTTGWVQGRELPLLESALMMSPPRATLRWRRIQSARGGRGKGVGRAAAAAAKESRQGYGKQLSARAGCHDVPRESSPEAALTLIWRGVGTGVGGTRGTDPRATTRWRRIQSARG